MVWKSGVGEEFEEFEKVNLHVLRETANCYSKHPHIRTHNFRGQTDCVLIYRMLSEKSASGCS